MDLRESGLPCSSCLPPSDFLPVAEELLLAEALEELLVAASPGFLPATARLVPIEALEFDWEALTG
jgi:hypothetical protein